MRKLFQFVDGFTMQMYLPVLHVIANITIRAVAMILHFFTETYPFPGCSLMAPVLVRSMGQRMKRNFIKITVRNRTNISIWDFLGASWQSSISKQRPISFYRNRWWKESM